MRAWIVSITIFLSCLSGYSQQQDKAGDADSAKESPTQKAAPLTTADTPGAKEAAAEANEPGSNGPTTAPAEGPTASQSGSPAVLSGGDGKDQDGTNTVQKASMNMAGARVEDVNLDDRRSVDADTEMQDRQERSRDTEASARDQQGTRSTAGESSEINEDSRRENYDRSDQNLSSKDRKKSGDDSGARKASDKKSKRKREKGR